MGSERHNEVIVTDPTQDPPARRILAALDELTLLMYQNGGTREDITPVELAVSNFLNKVRQTNEQR